MERAVCQKQHKSCRELHRMSVAAEARSMVAAIAGERGWGDTRESWIGKAALRLGFSYPRTRSIFYGRAKLSADEYIALCRAIEQLN